MFNSISKGHSFGHCVGMVGCYTFFGCTIHTFGPKILKGKATQRQIINHLNCILGGQTKPKKEAIQLFVIFLLH